MNSKSTWNWIVVAAALLAFLFALNRYLRRPDTGPARILPGIAAAAVTSITVQPAGQLGICAERANDAWQLTRPVSYPANATAVEGLLTALERLTNSLYITVGEIHARPNAYEQYGLDAPQAQLFISPRDSDPCQVLIGRRTPPGDQVYVQVVGTPGVHVVDAGLLKFIPRTTDDWRDPAFVDLRRLTFDGVIVTNNAKLSVELQRQATNHLWRMTWPLRNARTDNDRMAGLLQKLQDLRVAQFVTDDPKADIEAYGLQPAELELTLASGTNTVAVLQFGKSPTNDHALVYARCSGVNSIVTVASDSLAPWRAPYNDFRDRRLVTFSTPFDQIEVHGQEDFTLRRQSSNTWRLAPQNLPVDSGLANDFANALMSMEIVQFANDTATESDLRTNGLATPARRIVLTSAVPNAAGMTNLELSFGRSQDDKVFARRADEDSVYAVRLADFQRLPAAGWQLRERRLWNFSEDDVARLTIRQNGKVRELLRNGTNRWSLAPGSQGIINEFAIEETAHRFGELAAGCWVERGEQNLARFGFSTNGGSLVFELKSGEKRGIEFGGTAPSLCPYAAVRVDGQEWIFEFPLVLYQLVLGYLTIPPNGP